MKRRNLFKGAIAAVALASIELFGETDKLKSLKDLRIKKSKNTIRFTCHESVGMAIANPNSVSKVKFY